MNLNEIKVINRSELVQIIINRINPSSTNLVSRRHTKKVNNIQEAAGRTMFPIKYRTGKPAIFRDT